jgi:hypothetical protein
VPSPAEHDSEVDVGRLGAVGAEPVLLRFLRREDELDARLAGDVREPRQRRADRLRLAVRDHGRPLDGPRLL